MKKTGDCLALLGVLWLAAIGIRHCGFLLTPRVTDHPCVRWLFDLPHSTYPLGHAGLDNCWPELVGFGVVIVGAALSALASRRRKGGHSEA